MGLSALLPKTLLENHEHAVTLMQQVSDAALSTLQASHPLEELPARLWAEHSALAGCTPRPKGFGLTAAPSVCISLLYRKLRTNTASPFTAPGSEEQDYHQKLNFLYPTAAVTAVTAVPPALHTSYSTQSTAQPSTTQLRGAPSRTHEHLETPQKTGALLQAVFLALLSLAA